MSVPIILPCPFCGSTLPIQHINWHCVALRCECGIGITKQGAATTMYKRDELPDELKDKTYEPKLFVLKVGDAEIPYPDHGYVGVGAIVALEHSGALAIWNRRVAQLDRTRTTGERKI